MFLLNWSPEKEECECQGKVRAVRRGVPVQLPDEVAPDKVPPVGAVHLSPVRLLALSPGRALEAFVGEAQGGGGGPGHLCHLPLLRGGGLLGGHLNIGDTLQVRFNDPDLYSKALHINTIIHDSRKV